MCHLHHDQLKAVFHVCRKFREAVSLSFYCWIFLALSGYSLSVVLLFAMLEMVMTCSVLYKAVDARQSHFNYTTPDRSRQEQLSRTTPCSSDRWPFLW